MEDIFDVPSRQSRPQTTQSSQIPIKKQVSKNDFFIDIFENLDLGSEMYISEISKSKISDHKAQKITILWTLEVGTPILKHPVFGDLTI